MSFCLELAVLARVKNEITAAEAMKHHLCSGAEFRLMIPEGGLLRGRAEIWSVATHMELEYHITLTKEDCHEF